MKLSGLLILGILLGVCYLVYFGIRIYRYKDVPLSDKVLYLLVLTAVAYGILGLFV